MINFTLGRMPELIFGRDTEKRCGELMKAVGATKVLVVHSGEPFVRDLITSVKQSLSDAGLPALELAGVVPNPRLELIYEGIALCRKEGIDGVLAVGGGSVIDTAKGVALGVPYEGDVWDFYLQTVMPTTRLPLGAISTFAGTGSEFTRASVVTKYEEKLKRSADNVDIIRPDFAILNPVLTFSVPPYQTASGIADMTSHLLENYFSKTPNVDFSDNLTFAGLKTVLKNAPLVMQNPHDYDARAELMLLSPYAINGVLKMGRAGDWSCHLIEHEMSAEWDIAHGAGLAVITPVWMRYVVDDNVELFAKLGVNVFGLDYDFAVPSRTAYQTIERFEAFFASLSLPTRVSGFGITDVSEETMRRMAGRIPYYREDGRAIGAVKILHAEDIIEIYRRAL